MTDELINTMYEDGRTVDEIAEAVGKTPSEVDALLAKVDDGADPEKARERNRLHDLRVSRELGMKMLRKYMEYRNARLEAFESTADEELNPFEDMDTMIKIYKLISEQTLLAEGKMTEHIGVNGNAMPFNVVFTKTYEKGDEDYNDDVEDTEDF